MEEKTVANHEKSPTPIQSILSITEFYLMNISNVLICKEVNVIQEY